MTDSEKLDLVLSEIQGMKTEIQGMKTEIQDVKAGLEAVDEKVTRIDLTIENEIRVNIQRVAEGHLDLSRNMHEVMRPNNEIEMLAIKVRMMETDIREIKSKIS